MSIKNEEWAPLTPSGVAKRKKLAEAIDSDPSREYPLAAWMRPRASKRSARCFRAGREGGCR